MPTRQPTPYPDLNVVLGELVTRVQDFMGDQFIGAYLQGSFAVNFGPDAKLRMRFLIGD
jgi:hypothetical protein